MGASPRHHDDVCPSCGGHVVLVTDGLVGRLMCPTWFVIGRSETYWRMDPVPFRACTACEFCEEVRR
jgi:hypothetical protein